MATNGKVSYGSLQPTQDNTVKPIDIYATLEKLEHYITHTKQYSAANRKAVMFADSYMQNHYDLSVILKSRKSFSILGVKIILSEMDVSQDRRS